MTSLELSNISFSYKNSAKNAINNFSLKIEEGSFTTLLGPSGCGKTTLLRLISGFLEPDSGEIFINQENQNSIPPEKRKIGMVFQDYALFPHMTVYQNILYGLKIQKESKKLSKQDLNLKIKETAHSLDLQELLERYPHQLSGGQQQRVALARALVLNPKILLMDEPLSSLDTKLRTKVREELKEIQQKLKITTIYVTHDQEEAFSLSDYIAIINHGKLEQYGTPQQIYFEPATCFTAEMGGNANFIQREGKTLLVRPEWIELCDKETEDCLCAQVTGTTFLGEKIRVKTITKDQQIIAIDLPSAEYSKTDFSTLKYLKIKNKWTIL